MKTIVNYLTGSFTDYENREHQVVICGITKTPCCESDVFILDNNGDHDIIRTLSIGIAIQNPCDEPNEKLGKQIAFGKAVKSFPILVATQSGIITKAVVDAVMEKTLAYVKNSPGKYIASYSENEAKYKEKKLLIDKYNNLTEDEKKVFELCKKVNVSEIKELVNKLS